MASALRVDVRGIRELERRLDAVPPRIQNKVLRSALRKTTTRLKRELRRATVRDSGEARRQIKTKVRVGKRGAWGRVGYVAKPAFYMRLREVGSVRQPARPFFEQAVRGWEDMARDEFAQRLKEAVEREGL